MYFFCLCLGEKYIINNYRNIENNCIMYFDGWFIKYLLVNCIKNLISFLCLYL